MDADATTVPCAVCPWRRKSVRGWLGPLTAPEWIELAHSDEPIACHETIETDGVWTPGVTLQCRGAAVFRANVFKAPRDQTVAVGPRDTDRVFASNAEFTEHHDSPLADWLADQRRTG